MFYEDGVVWGGYHKGRQVPKIGGSAYAHGLQPGSIIAQGSPTADPVAADPSNPAYRIYRVRPDIGPRSDSASAVGAIASTELADISRYQTATVAAIYQQYVKDWNEWPAQEGAPFTDVDGDGKYDPRVDIPGQSGADQTLWYVANDMDASRTLNFAGSPPIGIEMQRTIWGYRRNMGALTTTIFVRSRLINKSGAPIDSMFLAQWSDPDVGDPGDDCVGFDTQRGLGYAYNGMPTDASYGATLPAGGFALIQGPIVPSAMSDSAFFEGGFRRGFKNLRVSAFVYFFPGYQFATPDSAAGADVQWFRAVNGLIPQSGLPYINPITNQPAKIVFTGDPVADTGWVDPINSPGPLPRVPHDMQMMMSAGPFRMAAGDTQEIVVAQVAALGTDRLKSIVALRTAVDALRGEYQNIVASSNAPLPVSPPAAPGAFHLYQNYPNPFNPLTTIRYALPVRADVRLTVYDMLGQKVRVLVDEPKEAGSYETRFDGTGLASGVYVYTITAGSFIQSKKLLLLR